MRSKKTPDKLFADLVGSGALAPFAELVRPLREHDLKRGGDLVRTLKVFFEANANASDAAQRLYLHRNSMKYRLDRVKSITGLDLRDPRSRLALQLGLLSESSREKERR